MSRDLGKSLEDIVTAGVDRVLTSGGEQNVEEGMFSVSRLNQAAKGRIVVMAGGGITESNVHRVIDGTHVREIHASVRAHVSSPMRHRNEKISMGRVKGHEYQRLVVLQEKVRRLLQAANNGLPHGLKAR